MAERREAPGNAFLVEEFVSSITTQLDRVQDALRIKAVNRPLTYALKELHLELKVFVDMDAQGQVMLRSAGPNEAGASTLAMDFTTITKPMIEENTISLAASRSTPLDKLGISTEEQQRLERLGVTNLAQLDRLRGSTGFSAVARMAQMPVDRLRRALQAGTPRLDPLPAPASPKPAPRPTPAPPPRPTPTQPTVPAPRPRPSGPLPPPQPRPSPRPAPIFQPGKPILGTPIRRPFGAMQGFAEPANAALPEDAAVYARQAETADADEDSATAAALGVISLSAGTTRLTLSGSNLQHEALNPEVRLNGEALEIEELDNDRIVVRLPQAFDAGLLEVSLGADLPAHHYAVVHATPPTRSGADGGGGGGGADPWAPALWSTHET